MSRYAAILLLVGLTLAGCESVAESARRGAQRGAERAAGREAERATDAAIARAASAAGSAARVPGGDGPDCAALLPDAGVAQTCRLKKVEGSPVTDDGDGCSRTYVRSPDEADRGLVLRVGRMGSATEARMSVQLQSASPTGGTARAVAAGDGGYASTLDADAGGGMGYRQHTVTFSSGATLVVLEATQLQDDRPALCTLDQMEALAVDVAGRLR